MRFILGFSFICPETRIYNSITYKSLYFLNVYDIRGQLSEINIFEMPIFNSYRA